MDVRKAMRPALLEAPILTRAEIPPRLLWKGRYAVLPQAAEPLLAADHKHRQGTISFLSTKAAAGGTEKRKQKTNHQQLWSLVPEETRAAYLAGKKKDTAPVLDLYVPLVTPIGLHLVGQVTGHPRLGSRTIVTSQLWFADPDGMWVRTLSRFYVLGRPGDEHDRILTSAMMTFDDRDNDDGRPENGD